MQKEKIGPVMTEMVKKRGLQRVRTFRTGLFNFKFHITFSKALEYWVALLWFVYFS